MAPEGEVEYALQNFQSLFLKGRNWLLPLSDLGELNRLPRAAGVAGTTASEVLAVHDYNQELGRRSLFQANFCTRSEMAETQPPEPWRCDFCIDRLSFPLTREDGSIALSSQS